jgi:hypothetical protein
MTRTKRVATTVAKQAVEAGKQAVEATQNLGSAAVERVGEIVDRVTP